MASIKILGTVENANSTSNTTNQTSVFSAKRAHLTNFGTSQALITIVPASGSNTSWVMLANSEITVIKNANDVIVSNSTSVVISKSIINA